MALKLSAPSQVWTHSYPLVSEKSVDDLYWHDLCATIGQTLGSNAQDKAEQELVSAHGIQALPFSSARASRPIWVPLPVHIFREEVEGRQRSRPGGNATDAAECSRRRGEAIPRIQMESVTYQRGDAHLLKASARGNTFWDFLILGGQGKATVCGIKTQRSVIIMRT